METGVSIVIPPQLKRFLTNPSPRIKGIVDKTDVGVLELLQRETR